MASLILLFLYRVMETTSTIASGATNDEHGAMHSRAVDVCTGSTTPLSLRCPPTQ